MGIVLTKYVHADRTISYSKQTSSNSQSLIGHFYEGKTRHSICRADVDMESYKDT